MVRIFVSPSHLCTLYMILYARATRKDGHKDVLILDSPPKKRSLKDLIKGTKKIYSWDHMIDLSTDLDDNVELTVDARKKLTRKLKTKPGFKQVYDALLKRHNKKLRAREADIVSSRIKELGEVVELNILTQTLVNDALLELYPEAKVNYFEHGLGDYYHIQSAEKKDNYYCVFAEQFKKFLKEQGREHEYVRPLPGLENFPSIAAEAMDKEDTIVKTSAAVQGKMVLILGENMQLYQVPDNYYTDFIDLVMKHVDAPEDHTFVLKPHPSQTSRSLSEQKKRLEEHHKVKTLVLDGGRFANISAEVLFSLWKEQTDQFFSHISSAGFYNSVLYKECKTSFYYSYEFMFPYMKNAPPQYRDAYLQSGELIKKVFGANSTPMQV